MPRQKIIVKKYRAGRNLVLGEILDDFLGKLIK